MMKQTLGFLLLGAATFACSGRYYEVGGMDGVAGVSGNRGAAGGAAPGGSSSATAGSPDPGAGASGGTNTAGPAMPAGPLCVPGGVPAKVTGPFADAAVVWRRISMLTLGTPTAPRTDLPAVTTYAWSGAAVNTAFDEASEQRYAPGVATFLRQALGLDASVNFGQDWGLALTSTNDTLLHALLLRPPHLPGSVGIFTDSNWLTTRTTISARGAAIEDFLFGSPIPSPPPDIENPEPNPNLSDRANLEAAVSSNAPCIGCHQLMDPVGFALGNFASDGSYRELDHGLPIDTTGSRRSGMYPEEFVEFDGIGEFGQKFENDCAALRGIAYTFLRAAVVINAPPQGPQSELVDANVERVQQAFINSDRTYEDLVRSYIQSPAGLRP